MKIQVTNLSTGEKSLFVNDYSLTYNIVSAIIIDEKRTGDLLNKEVRDMIEEKYPVRELKSKKTKRLFAYCSKKDLHARFII